jgi:hypothetical protein
VGFERRNPDHLYVIPCRECAEPLYLDPWCVQRLAGRAFIECPSCRHLIWVRRADVRQAERVTAAMAKLRDEPLVAPAPPPVP